MNKIKLFIFLILFLISQQFYAQVSDEAELIENSSCISCHLELEYMPEDYSDLDIHMKSEISCHGCHGGDPSSEIEEVAMSAANGFIPLPKVSDIPAFCGKCHSDINYMRTYQPRISTDQESQYYTSVHGIQLKKGDEKVATCVSCHSAHYILPSNDPRSKVYALNIPNTCNNCHGESELMTQYDLAADQYTEYSEGVHGTALLVNKDIGAPACNDCHGNHGALPPGIESISHVCGICHANNMEYFTHSAMARPFDEMEFHACEQCHSHHNIKKTNEEMIGVGEESLCTDCHEEGDSGYKTALSMSKHISSFKELYKTGQEKLNDVKNKGMNDVDIEFLLKDANQRLIQSRTLVHTFDTNRVSKNIDEGALLANNAVEIADSEINEYYTRRNGFAIATVAFLFLAVVLFIKVRQIRDKNNT